MKNTNTSKSSNTFSPGSKNSRQTSKSTSHANSAKDTPSNFM